MYHGERFNSSTHLVGTALAITGSAVLITRAVLDGDPWKIISFSLFGTMLVVLYAVSTLYHSIRASRAKALFRRLDHCAIYLLIAGSYTPFTLVTLRGAFGWTMFGTIWAMAANGIFRAWRQTGDDDPSVWPYLVMGCPYPCTATDGATGYCWCPLARCGRPLVHGGHPVLHQRHPLAPRSRGLAPVVLGGSTAHFFAVLRYVG